MARKSEQYVVGILFATETETTIKYVTDIQNEPKIVKWDNGEERRSIFKRICKGFSF